MTTWEGLCQGVFFFVQHSNEFAVELIRTPINWSAQCFCVVLSNLQYEIDVFLWCNICCMARHGCALPSSLPQGSVGWDKRPTYFRGFDVSWCSWLESLGFPGLALLHCVCLFPLLFLQYPRHVWLRIPFSLEAFFFLSSNNKQWWPETFKRTALVSTLYLRKSDICRPSSSDIVYLIKHG